MVVWSVTGTPSVAVFGVIAPEIRSLGTGTSDTVAVPVPVPATLVHVSVYVVVMVGATGKLPAAAGVTGPIPLSIEALVAPLVQL